MTDTLLTSQLASLPLIARGKVRDNYAVGNESRPRPTPAGS